MSPLITPDGRYLIVRNRLWRTTNPALSDGERARLTRELMAARRAGAAARRAGNPRKLREARDAVNSAKVALGERGPVWWSDGAPDYNRHLAKNTPYAHWYANMSNDFVAQVSTTIDAPRSDVWKALVTPSAIKQYMFGTTVVSDWKAGSPIVWKGEWEGRAYEDKGVILQLEPSRLLRYSHFSPLSGQPDKPENYHTVTIELSEAVSNQTLVILSQDNNPTEQARAHSEKNWTMMLAGLKKFVEG